MHASLYMCNIDANSNANANSNADASIPMPVFTNGPLHRKIYSKLAEGNSEELIKFTNQLVHKLALINEIYKPKSYY